MEREGREGWRERESEGEMEREKGGRNGERGEGGMERESEGEMEREKEGREGIMLLSCTCIIIHNMDLSVIGGFKSRPRKLIFPLENHWLF